MWVNWRTELHQQEYKDENTIYSFIIDDSIRLFHRLELMICDAYVCVCVILI